MTTNELKKVLIEAGAEDSTAMLAALEDGATLAALGVTDADQETVEELHAELSAA